MKKILVLLMVILSVTSLSARDLSGKSLFADHRSREIGDILTVMIMDNAQASNEAKTSNGTSSKIGASAKASGALDFIPLMGADASLDNSYTGSGKTERKGALRATLAAKITEILPNGNLLIEGSKTVEVNGEKQITALNGMVRPQDILDNNAIYSNNIANLQINYTGDGANADAESPGMISRFINWLF